MMATMIIIMITMILIMFDYCVLTNDHDCHDGNDCDDVHDNCTTGVG